MGDTLVEWTDKVWNPVTGCTKVSQGCKNCYAETIANRFWGERKFTEVRCHYERLDIPLHWQKPRRIFVNSMSDLFHEEVEDPFIGEVFGVMCTARQHTFQILTKRPRRMREFMSTYTSPGGPLPPISTTDNIWLGVSVEDQVTADERIPLLLQTPAVVRFLSCEPLLNQVNIGMYLSRTKGLDWIICGAESGPHARPMDLDWARSLRDQCKVAGVKFFMKQLCDKGRKIPLHLWPTDLLVREYPDVE